MNHSDPKTVVTQFLRYMGSNEPGGVEKAGEMFAEDASFWIAGDTPISGLMVGREKIMENRFRPANKRIVAGSKSLEIGKVMAEGEFVAAEWTSRRRVVDSKDYENAFFGLFQISDGKIKSLREYLDTQKVIEAGWFHSSKKL